MRSRGRTFTTILLTAAAVAAIAQGDSWRPAALAVVAAAAVLATRIRYAAVLAIAALAVVSGLALAGRGVALDARAVPRARPAAHHAQHHHHRHHRKAPRQARHITKDEE